MMVVRIKYLLVAICLALVVELAVCHLAIRAEQLSVWDNGGQYDVNVGNTFPGHVLLNAVLQIESQVQIAQIWGAEQVGTCPPPAPKDGTPRDMRSRDASCVLVSLPLEQQCLGVKAQTGESWSFSFALMSGRGYANFTAAISARVFAVQRNFTTSPTSSTTPFPRHKIAVKQRPGRVRLENGETVVVPWSLVVRSFQEREWIQRLSLSIPCTGPGGADSLRDLTGARFERSDGDCRLVFPEDMRIPPGGTYELVSFNTVVYYPQPLSLTSIRAKSDVSALQSTL